MLGSSLLAKYKYLLFQKLSMNTKLVKPSYVHIVLIIAYLLLSFYIPKPFHEENMDGVIDKVQDNGFGYPLVFYGDVIISDFQESGFFVIPFIINLLIASILSFLVIGISRYLKK